MGPPRSRRVIGDQTDLNTLESKENTQRAPVSVTALGLEPGETLTLRAGFRYYTNAASLSLRVV